MQSSMTPYQPGAKLDDTTALLIGMKEKGTLQSYVAAHQGKPEYPTLLALATSINNISAADQAAKQQPPTQTVADQRLASLAPQQPQPQQMLPENVGIGQLPAPNMRKLADGGITGYADDEDATHMAGGGVVAFASGGWNRYAPSSYGNTATPEQYTPEQLAEAQRLRNLGLWDTLKEKFGPTWQALTTPPGNKAVQQTYQSGTDIGGPGSSPANMGAPAVGPTVDFKNQTGAPDTRGLAGLNAGAGAGGTPAGGIASSYEKQFLDLFKGDTSKEDRMKEITDINAPVLEKMKTTIDENRSKLKSDKEENFYMALVQGGLAAAAGAGPYALQNIAHGFEKGAASYSEGLKDLRKAAQENTKMELAMSEFEASGKKEALKSYYDHQDKMQTAKTQGYASILGHEISGKYGLAAAGAGANAQRNLMEALGNAPESSALRKGFEMTKQEGRIPVMYDAYVKAATDPMKGEDFKRMYPDFQTYLAGMGGAGAGKFINVPAGVQAPILPRK